MIRRLFVLFAILFVALPSLALPPSGTVTNTVVSALPGNEPTACEPNYLIRMLWGAWDGQVPRRMYYAATGTSTSTPSLYISLSLGANATHPALDPSSGAILVAALNPVTGALEITGTRQFSECTYMMGIDVSSDGSLIGALCRRPWGDLDFTADSLATHSDWDWMTEQACSPQEAWLYEWTNGNIQTAPSKYVVHRAVGGDWEYANNYLELGENQNTWGMGLKARVFGGGLCHEADAFLVMDRSDHSLFSNSGVDGRGWSWACATGHTLQNRPAYNPATGRYGLLCATDGNHQFTANLGGFFFRQDDELNPDNSLQFRKVNTDMWGVVKGGVSSPVPLADGGFLGLIVAADTVETGNTAYPEQPPTSIGLVRFDSAGAQVGGVTWLVQDSRKYLSFPQLAPLGNGRYLLGWAEMYDFDRAAELGDFGVKEFTMHTAQKFWLQEIDVAGTALTEPASLSGVGWGEQDRLEPLGDGRVAWAYLPNPELVDVNSPPSCNSSSLQLSVYSSVDASTLFADGFEGGSTAAWTSTVTPGTTFEILQPVSVWSTSEWNADPDDGRVANLINGSGLSGTGPVVAQTHDNAGDASTMWHSGPGDGGLGCPCGSPPTVASQDVVFDLGVTATLEGAYVWNHNQTGATNRGVDQYEILVSGDSNPATAIYSSVGFFNLAQSGGGAQSSELVTFSAAGARLVKFAIGTHYAADPAYVGLSEVRFRVQVPAAALESGGH